MTISIAVTGKSGSGKTTVVRGFFNLFKEFYPDKSILLFDNDLSCELGHTFGFDIRNTIYGIRSGKHEYKTGIPSKMTKQEYIEWAIEDILVKVDDNTDIIVSWLIASKDCRCPITKQINDALQKLINRYDFVIFDCEFDLKYLNQLVDVNIDVTLILADCNEEAVSLASRIEQFSAKYAAGGQLGVILNCIKNTQQSKIYELLNKYELETLGIIPFDENLNGGNISKNSKVVTSALRQMFSRFNFPQIQT